jgi:hypothetical protein
MFTYLDVNGNKRALFSKYETTNPSFKGDKCDLHVLSSSRAQSRFACFLVQRRYTRDSNGW